MASIKSSVDEFVDDRPFCEDCSGYTCGGLGVYEPVCCCDSDDESEEEEERKEICCECGKFKDTPTFRGMCLCKEKNKPSIFERLALPTHEEFELLPPDEQRLMLHKASAELATATDAEVAAAVKALEANAAVKVKAMEANAEAKVKAVETKAKKTIKLKLKKKKPIKLKLKLKKEC